MADGVPPVNTIAPDGTGYRERLWTVDELFRLGDMGALNDPCRYELWDGRLVVNPPPGNHHGRAETKLLRRFFVELLRLDPGEERFVVHPGAGLQMSDNTWLQPDLAIVSPTDPDDVPRLTPSEVHLCVEVSRSTLRDDLDYKRKKYAAAQISEYWVVNTIDKQLHRFRTPERGDYAEMQIIETGDTVSPLFESRITIAIGDLF